MTTSTLSIVLVAVSIAMFVGTLIAIPIVVVRLPADYFVRGKQKRPFWVHLAFNSIGLVVFALGVAMLVLPGQGVLTILIGLSIMDLPVKHRVVRWCLGKPKVAQAIQALRKRADKPPLLLPSDAAGEEPRVT